MKTVNSKVFVVFVLCLIIPMVGTAQQRPQFSQYMVNNQLINPGVSGAYDYAVVQMSFRQQWAGFEGAPRTLVLNGHSTIAPTRKKALPTIGTIAYDQLDTNEDKHKNSGIKHGVGGLLYLDQTAATDRIMLYGSYALHIPVNQDIKISAGFNLGIINWRHNNDKLNPLNDDPVIGNGTVSILVPDLEAGIWVYSDKFYGGFSISQLLKGTLPIASNAGGRNNELLMHYYATGGYRFELNNQLQLVPSVLVKVVGAAPPSIDINGRLVYKETVWGGLSYRAGDALAALVGFGLGSFEFNYAYDYPVTTVSRVTIATHELTLKYRLGRRKYKFKHNLF